MASFCEPGIQKYVYLILAAAYLYAYYTNAGAKEYSDEVYAWAFKNLSTTTALAGNAFTTLWTMGVKFFTTRQPWSLVPSLNTAWDVYKTVQFVSQSLASSVLVQGVAWVMCGVVTQVYNITALSLQYPLLAAAAAAGIYAYSMTGGRTMRGGKSPIGGCSRKFTAKYMERPSPPYPANECCGRIARGNDGGVYRSSRVGAQRACSWKSMSTRKSPKRKSRSRR